MNKTQTTSWGTVWLVCLLMAVRLAILYFLSLVFLAPTDCDGYSTGLRSRSPDLSL